MKIWLLSDLHIDLNPPLDLGAHPECDLIVMAGDLSDGDFDPSGWLLKTFSDDERCKIVFVPGNHERWRRRQPLDQLADRTGIIVLDRDIYEHAGHRILGCTMWSPLDPELDGLGGDLKAIPGFSGEAWRAAHARDREWLADEVRPGDIVVTHHAPHWDGLSTSMQQDMREAAVASAYYADMSDLVEMAQPSIWIHGHTHVTRDYEVANCRVVTNARGRGWTSHFKPGMLIELDDPAPKPRW